MSAPEESRARVVMKLPEDGRRRVVIEGVKPEIDCGRYPAKRILGDRVVVEADIFADGHDLLSAVLLHRREDEPQWTETPMRHLGNDRWRGEFTAGDLGRHRYTLKAWIDRFATWRDGLAKKLEAGQDVAVELLIGGALVEEASSRAVGIDRKLLETHARTLRSQDDDRIACALGDDLAELMATYPDRRLATSYDKDLSLVVDRERARFSTWYELFPRSCADTPGRHGTFKHCERRLPYVASMGFDVLYLPPIHPIGRVHRKGANNAPVAGPDDPGSVWAIGAAEGGHTDIHPELGTLADFKALVAAAAQHGLEVAMDLAFQCTPDHPWVKVHVDWFRRRPDGSVQYAENPPKKYEDIYPLDFETGRWAELWEGLTDVVRFWIDQGIRIFRVDNPHTKPFAFWEHLITTIKRTHPDVIFLAEAFTRPKVMYRLAKLGFTQSYTYFTWRNTKWELAEYLTELTATDVRDYFRPHFWPNTPDILNAYLQLGGRPAFVTRLVLAATLAASYGIYGPAFELCERAPFAPGSEEYLHSEKYEIRRWDLQRADSLHDLIARVNEIRRENPALQRDTGLRFHGIDNDQLIAYTKESADGANVLLIVVNLDPHHAQSGWLDFPFEDFGLEPREPYQVHDLLTNAHYLWHGRRNFIALDPHAVPAHIFRIRRRAHSERDFDYFA